MEDHENLSGRARVRALLIEPLVRDGLRRPGNVPADAHEAMLKRLAERLAYLDAPLLVTLHEVVLRLAEGHLRNTWPTFATIFNEARRLREPPDDERHIMTSWLRSVEGPRAREAGHLVELHEWLRKHGRPPDSYAMGKIRDAAAENARQRARVAERVEAGQASPDDLRWLDWYTGRMAYCEALVAGGVTGRAEAGGAA